MLSVIIPANNEEMYLATCLDALLRSHDQKRRVARAGDHEDARPVEVIIVANGCTDDTAEIARGYIPKAEARGWVMKVLDIKAGGKLNALNVGDETAQGDVRIYMDADVIVTPQLLAQIGEALDRPDAAYASGTLVVSRGMTWVSRAYARFWCRLPFVAEGVPGCGIYAVNSAGRGRWQAFPEIISDDTFVRLHFRPTERLGVPASYEWPMVEGFRNLVKVRKRQDIGVDEIVQRYPELVPNEGKSKLGFGAMAGLASREFVGFCIYVAVSLAVRFSRLSGDAGWARGR